MPAARPYAALYLNGKRRNQARPRKIKPPTPHGIKPVLALRQRQPGSLQLAPEQLLGRTR
jgi:hypothetical protein